MLRKYASVEECILREKLRWAEPGPEVPADELFVQPDDYMVLVNDFPYALAEGIVVSGRELFPGARAV